MAGQQSTAGTAQAVHPTLKQRGDNATRDLRQAAHLPTNPQDSNVLLTALAEAATREARRNPQFASDIQRTYAQILAMRGRAGQGKSKGAQPQLPPLVALHPDPTYPIDTFGPIDIPYLIRVYERQQLGRALYEYGLDKLKQASAPIEAAHPGTKPKNKSSKQSVIDYIVKHS